jgi:uncharacterized protein (DUF4415 family)
MSATRKVTAKAAPKPAKKRIRVALDSDVLAWLKKDCREWNVRANRMLREEIMKDLEGR